MCEPYLATGPKYFSVTPCKTMLILAFGNYLFLQATFYKFWGDLHEQAQQSESWCREEGTTWYSLFTERIGWLGEVFHSIYFALQVLEREFFFEKSVNSNVRRTIVCSLQEKLALHCESMESELFLEWTDSSYCHWAGIGRSGDIFHNTGVLLNVAETRNITTWYDMDTA